VPVFVIVPEVALAGPPWQRVVVTDPLAGL
jgi:hypothetical protein